MSKREINEVLLSVKKFPCKISSFDGNRIKQIFQQVHSTNTENKNIKSLKFKYWKEIDGDEYFLIEEYLFNDRETILDINHSIAVNYYLNKLGN